MVERPGENYSVKDAHIADAVERSLRSLGHLMRIHTHQFARKYGLTGPQLVLLRKIPPDDEMSVGKLAVESNLSQGTITGIVDRLEKLGLILKYRSKEDRRKVLVKLTPSAGLLLKQKPELSRHRVAETLQSLPRQEQIRILETLQKLEKLIGGAD
ncbi:MAG: MarR family winged helix-turn-helix transcriptional regulator [Desulfobacterales bacterium]